MRVLGMISGTSHDGIDACVLDLRWEGTEIVGRIVAGDSVPYGGELRARLRAALPPADVSMGEVCRLDTLIGGSFGEVAAQVAREAGGVDLVCSHGQTVFHWVESGRALGTLQLGEPAFIEASVGVPVVADVRAADIAAGGQGAPLVPILDTLLLAGAGSSGGLSSGGSSGMSSGGSSGVSSGSLAALNLGGIANSTVLPGDGSPAYAYDHGPANALVDAAVSLVTGEAQAYDADGARAARGHVDDELLADLLAEPYYALPAPKSTGKELFHDGYVDAARERHPGVSDDDLVATLTELTARVVAADLTRDGVVRVIASGGGVRNPVLLQRISSLLPQARVESSEAVGLPSDLKEAAAFALIGFLTAHGLPSNVPSCTGASRPVVLGSITGAGAAAVLTTPPSGVDAATRLRLEPT